MKQIFHIMNYIIQIQSKKGAVGPTALTTVTLLIRLLIKSTNNNNNTNSNSNNTSTNSNNNGNTDNNSDNSQLPWLISETIESIAKRGQYTSQNIDIMNAIMSNMKSCRNDREMSALLMVVLRVAAHSCATVSHSQTKFYPDALIKTVVDELWTMHHHYYYTHHQQHSHQQQSSNSESGSGDNGSSDDVNHAFNRQVLLQLIQALIQNASATSSSSSSTGSRLSLTKMTSASSSSSSTATAALVHAIVDDSYVNVNNSSTTTIATSEVITITAAADSTVGNNNESASTSAQSSAAQSSQSSAALALAVLSKKQRDDVHSVLFRILLSISSLPLETGILVQVLKTLNCMLKQYRNKDLESSIPLIIRVQQELLALEEEEEQQSQKKTQQRSSNGGDADGDGDGDEAVEKSTTVDGSSSSSSSGGETLSGEEKQQQQQQQATPAQEQVETADTTTTTTKTNKVMSKEQWRMVVAVHSLIALFLLSLSKLSSNKDLERYVISVIEQRIEQGQIHANILNNMDQLLAQMDMYNYNYPWKSQSTMDHLLIELFSATTTSTTTTTSQNRKMIAFNAETIVDVLCKVESIKQTYGGEGARERLLTPFVGTIPDARIGGSGGVSGGATGSSGSGGVGGAGGAMNKLNLMMKTGQSNIHREEDLDAHWDMIDDESIIGSTTANGIGVVGLSGFGGARTSIDTDFNEANTDTEMLTVDNVEQSSQQVIQAINFFDLGDHSTAKAQKSQRAVHDLLNSISSSSKKQTNVSELVHVSDDNDDDSSTDYEDKWTTATATVVHHDVVRSSASINHGSRVTQSVPQFHLFDSPEFLMTTI